MKKIAFIAWAFLWMPFFSSAQATLYYTINLGVFAEPKRDDFQALHAIGFLYATHMENSHAQIYLGGYESKSMAQNALARVQAAGYTAAALQEVYLQTGETVSIVQLASTDFRKPINWPGFENVPELWGILSGDNLRLAAGPYRSPEEARRALPTFQKGGFKDAFVRTINSMYLIKIGTFESGGALKQPLIAFKWSENTPPAISAKPTQPQRETPPAYDYPTRPGEVVLPPSTPPTATRETPPAEYDGMVSKGVNSPLRGNVKRSAAAELQKALQMVNQYAGSLDGYYGPATAQGYSNALASNSELIRYRLFVANAGKSGTGDALQQAIDHLAEDTRLIQTLENYDHPIAKAYLAYQIFVSTGPGYDVNQLMNNAIRQAYTSRPTRLTAPFDYQATYAYNDLNQLILHLYYIHAAPNSTYTVPCWLSQQHPQESARAQAALSSMNTPLQVLPSCSPFSAWEDMQMLEAMASDMGGEEVPAVQQAQASAAKAALYVASRPLGTATQRELDLWHQSLMNNLGHWAQRDPLHQRFLPPFKILFYQTAVRLEDFFMDKGFGSEEARVLALATLRSSVGPSLQRFQ